MEKVTENQRNEENKVVECIECVYSCLAGSRNKITHLILDILYIRLLLQVKK